MKLIFIIGNGHSGSTILDKAIGSHSKAFSLGELSKFSATVDRQGLCSCGEKITACEIWSQQIQRIVNRDSIRISQFESLFPTKIATLNSSLFLNMGEFILQLLGLNVFLNRYNKRCVKNNIKIQRAINKLGFTHLIDSSKSLRKAVMIANQIGHENCLFIHLVRDGRAVINSYGKDYYLLIDPPTSKMEKFKRKKEDPHKILNSWIYNNLFAHYYLSVFFKNQSMMVKYEDLCTHPDEIINTIWQRAGLKVSNQNFNLAYKAHIIGGNASRMNATKINLPSRSWEKNMDSKQQSYFLRKAKYAMKLFGYK